MTTLESGVDIDRVTALLPPDNSYANATTSIAIKVSGTCISGSAAVKISVINSEITVALTCDGETGAFGTTLDLTSLPDGDVKIEFAFLKTANSNNVVYALKRNVIKDTNHLPVFTVPGSLSESGSKTVTINEVAGAALYRTTFTPQGGGAVVGPVETTTTAVPVSGLTIGTTYTVSVVAIDAAGNETAASNTGTFTKTDTDPPVFTSLALTGEAADGYINLAEKDGTTELAGNLVASGQTTTEFALGLASATCASMTYGATIPTVDDLPPSDAKYKVCVKLEDGTNTTYGASADIERDIVLPTSTSILINSGATSTTTTAVTLTLAATGASAMYISNTAGCGSGGTYEAYATSKAWTLAQTNGTATVYVKFKDAAGNETACTNDTITHEDTPPSQPDSWTATSTTQAPALRRHHAAVWTGSKLIVWGGGTGGEPVLVPVATGGIYDPVADSWTAVQTAGAPDARQNHAAIWTGSKMIVWGGIDRVTETAFDSGGAFDPVLNQWSNISAVGAPSPRWFPYSVGAVWTGTEMIVWGGSVFQDGVFGVTNTGGHYDPSSNSWSSTTLDGAPLMRRGHAMHWAGTKLVVWGGVDDQGAAYGDGAIYIPGTGWSSITSTNAPDARTNFTSVLAGTKMMVWGGHNGSELQTGSVYDIPGNQWTAMETTNAPLGRVYASAVWTGSKVIVWGGYSGGEFEESGGIYDPATNEWGSTQLQYAPEGRIWHSAFWTGSAMLIWGGSTAFGHGSDVISGGMYTPP
ncbi:MAG: hypothetical protein RIQ81_266 [Pseudomonadota bacterium]